MNRLKIVLCFFTNFGVCDTIQYTSLTSQVLPGDSVVFMPKEGYEWGQFYNGSQSIEFSPPSPSSVFSPPVLFLQTIQSAITANFTRGTPVLLHAPTLIQAKEGDLLSQNNDSPVLVVSLPYYGQAPWPIRTEEEGGLQWMWYLPGCFPMEGTTAAIEYDESTHIMTVTGRPPEVKLGLLQNGAIKVLITSYYYFDHDDDEVEELVLGLPFVLEHNLQLQVSAVSDTIANDQVIYNLAPNGGIKGTRMISNITNHFLLYPPGHSIVFSAAIRNSDATNYPLVCAWTVTETFITISQSTPIYQIPNKTMYSVLSTDTSLSWTVPNIKTTTSNSTNALIMIVNCSFVLTNQTESQSILWLVLPMEPPHLSESSSSFGTTVIHSGNNTSNKNAQASNNDASLQNNKSPEMMILIIGDGSTLQEEEATRSLLTLQVHRSDGYDDEVATKRRSNSGFLTSLDEENDDRDSISPWWLHWNYTWSVTLRQGMNCWPLLNSSKVVPVFTTTTSSLNISLFDLSIAFLGPKSISGLCYQSFDVSVTATSEVGSHTIKYVHKIGVIPAIIAAPPQLFIECGSMGHDNDNNIFSSSSITSSFSSGAGAPRACFYGHPFAVYVSVISHKYLKLSATLTITASNGDMLIRMVANMQRISDSDPTVSNSNEESIFEGRFQVSSSLSRKFLGSKIEVVLAPSMQDDYYNDVAYIIIASKNIQNVSVALNIDAEGGPEVLFPSPWEMQLLVPSFDASRVEFYYENEDDLKIKAYMNAYLSVESPSIHEKDLVFITSMSTLFEHMSSAEQKNGQELWMVLLKSIVDPIATKNASVCGWHLSDTIAIHPYPLQHAALVTFTLLSNSTLSSSSIAGDEHNKDCIAQIAYSFESPRLHSMNRSSSLFNPLEKMHTSSLTIPSILAVLENAPPQFPGAGFIRYVKMLKEQNSDSGSSSEQELLLFASSIAIFTSHTFEASLLLPTVLAGCIIGVLFASACLSAYNRSFVKVSEAHLVNNTVILGSSSPSPPASSSLSWSSSSLEKMSSHLTTFGASYAADSSFAQCIHWAQFAIMVDQSLAREHPALMKFSSLLSVFSFLVPSGISFFTPTNTNNTIGSGSSCTSQTDEIFLSQQELQIVMIPSDASASELLHASMQQESVGVRRFLHHISNSVTMDSGFRSQLERYFPFAVGMSLASFCVIGVCIFTIAVALGVWMISQKAHAVSSRMLAIQTNIEGSEIYKPKVPPIKMIVQCSRLASVIKAGIWVLSQLFLPVMLVAVSSNWVRVATANNISCFLPSFIASIVLAFISLCTLAHTIRQNTPERSNTTSEPKMWVFRSIYHIVSSVLPHVLVGGGEGILLLVCSPSTSLCSPTAATAAVATTMQLGMLALCYSFQVALLLYHHLILKDRLSSSSPQVKRSFATVPVLTSAVLQGLLATVLLYAFANIQLEEQSVDMLSGVAVTFILILTIAISSSLLLATVICYRKRREKATVAACTINNDNPATHVETHNPYFLSTSLPTSFYRKSPFPLAPPIAGTVNTNTATSATAAAAAAAAAMSSDPLSVESSGASTGLAHPTVHLRTPKARQSVSLEPGMKMKILLHPHISTPTERTKKRKYALPRDATSFSNMTDDVTTVLQTLCLDQQSDHIIMDDDNFIRIIFIIIRRIFESARKKLTRTLILSGIVRVIVPCKSAVAGISSPLQYHSHAHVRGVLPPPPPSLSATGGSSWLHTISHHVSRLFFEGSRQSAKENSSIPDTYRSSPIQSSLSSAENKSRDTPRYEAEEMGTATMTTKTTTEENGAGGRMGEGGGVDSIGEGGGRWVMNEKGRFVRERQPAAVAVEVGGTEQEGAEGMNRVTQKKKVNNTQTWRTPWDAPSHDERNFLVCNYPSRAPLQHRVVEKEAIVAAIDYHSVLYGAEGGSGGGRSSSAPPATSRRGVIGELEGGVRG